MRNSFLFMGLTIALLVMVNQKAMAQVRQEIVYKTIDTTKLKMTFFYPEGYQKGTRLPAIILFFGGGWNAGNQGQFFPQAIYFAKHGMIGITADYRVKNRQNTSPFEAVEDAKSAISYLRENAETLGIDTTKIAAGGGSAGGHLAAATDLIAPHFGTSSKFSCRPNALVLFNPVFNNGPDNYGYERFGERYTTISPYHNIKKGAAPTIVFLGKKDNLIPVVTAERYQQAMEEVGSRCELYLYDDQPHGFFNYKSSPTNPYFEDTMQKAKAFLQSLGYIPKDK